MITQPIAFVSLLLLCAGQPASSVRVSWPGLWGPARNGVVPVALRAPFTPKELWRRPSEGGYSEIAIVGDRAITMDLRKGVDFVVALDAASGRDLWAARIGQTYRGHDSSLDGPIATPTIDGSDVFATGPHGVVVALDLASGKERWRHDLVAEFAATLPAWGFASSPLVEGDLVIVPTGGPKARGLLAFERSGGRLAWSAEMGRTPTYSSPVAATLGGVRQVIVAAGDRIVSVSATDGQPLWSTNGAGPSYEQTTSPIVLPDDRVFISHWEESRMLKVARQKDRLTVTELWRSPRLRGTMGPVVYRDGHLFSRGGGLLTCADAATGEVRWRERASEGPLLASASHLVLLDSRSGDLQVVEASPRGYREVSRARVLTPDVVSVTGPSIADGRIYIRNTREMAAFAF
jgi:outer membrane protein assembly factor BamB